MIIIQYSNSVIIIIIQYGNSVLKIIIQNSNYNLYHFVQYILKIVLELK